MRAATHPKRRWFRHEGRKLVWPGRVPRTHLLTEFTSGEQGDCYGVFKGPGGEIRIGWSSSGNVSLEEEWDARGLRRGLECSRFDDGSLQWAVPWVLGQMHGFARQYDESGRELFRSRFVRGTGVDLWVGCGEISEVREMVKGSRHGYERWGHPLSPWEESHYLAGKSEGITRRWTGAALDPGYPQFFVDDREVTRARYLRARRKRPELPPYRSAEDRRERTLPKSVLRAWIRKELRALLLTKPAP